ncbi:excalibur calcium-binding domain-containing protein [Paracoccaceae bacterium GXU_MW_L88]
MRFFLGFFMLASAGFAQSDMTPRVDLDGLLLAQTYDCRRKTCGQMRSCDEACYKLTVCGDTARDGDNDGIPCESICGTRRCD